MMSIGGKPRCALKTPPNATRRIQHAKNRAVHKLSSLVDRRGRHPDATRRPVGRHDYFEIDEAIAVRITQGVSLRGQRRARDANINDLKGPRFWV